MHDSHRPLAYSLLMIGLAVTTIPLILGGLVAAGEANDGRILLFGMVSLVASVIVGLKRPSDNSQSGTSATRTSEEAGNLKLPARS